MHRDRLRLQGVYRESRHEREGGPVTARYTAAEVRKVIDGLRYEGLDGCQDCEPAKVVLIALAERLEAEEAELTYGCTPSQLHDLANAALEQAREQGRQEATAEFERAYGE